MFTRVRFRALGPGGSGGVWFGVKAQHYHLSGEIMWNWWQSKAECCGCWLLRVELNGGLLGFRLLGSRSRFGAARWPKWVNPCRCWRACSTCMMGRRSIEMLRLATFSWPHRFDLRFSASKKTYAWTNMEPKPLIPPRRIISDVSIFSFHYELFLGHVKWRVIKWPIFGRIKQCKCMGFLS